MWYVPQNRTGGWNTSSKIYFIHPKSVWEILFWHWNFSIKKDKKANIIDLKRVDIGVLGLNHVWEMASCGARLVWVLNTQLGRHTKSYLQPNRDLYSDKGFDISTRSLGDTMCPIFCLTSDCTNGYMHHRYMQWIGWWSYFGPCCTSCWCLKSRDNFVPTSLETQCDARSWRKETWFVLRN